MRKRQLFFLLYLTAAVPGRANAGGGVNMTFIDQLPECSQSCLQVNHTIMAPNACDDEETVKNNIYACTDKAYCDNWNEDGTNSDWLAANNEHNAACGGKEVSTLPTSTTSATASSLATTSSDSTSSAMTTPTISSLNDLAANTSSPTIVPKSSPKLSTGAIVGIVIGGLSFLLLLGALIFLIFRNRRQNRRQAGSMILEQHPPSGPGHNELWKPMTANAGWVTVNSTSSTPTFQANASAWPLVGINDRSTTPPVSNSATQRLAPLTIMDQNTPEVPVEPVSPPTAGIGNRGQFTQQLAIYPFPPPIPIDEPLSPVSPVSTRKTGLESAASSMVSMDNFSGPSAVTHDDFVSQERRHTCSTPAARLPNESRRISAGSTGSLARAESVAWRREVEEAAQRATNRVVMSEQQAAVQSEGSLRSERSSKGSAIPGLDRLTRKRWSKDSQDSEFYVGTPPTSKSQGFLSRKRVSDGSGKGVFIV